MREHGIECSRKLLKLVDRSNLAADVVISLGYALRDARQLADRREDQLLRDDVKNQYGQNASKRASHQAEHEVVEQCDASVGRRIINRNYAEQRALGVLATGRANGQGNPVEQVSLNVLAGRKRFLTPRILGQFINGLPNVLVRTRRRLWVSRIQEMNQPR